MTQNDNQQQENRAFKKEDAYETLGIINTWIGNMDTKVSFALALAGVLIGVIFEKGMPSAFERITEVSKLAELSGGEIIQLKNASTEGFSESSYFNVIKLKTAALFAASAELAAISVGAKESVVSQMKELGETIGICFQIRDDIFDYYNDSAVGKPTGNDLLEGKMTLPLIYALEHTDDLEMKALALKVKNEGVSKEEIDKLVAFSKAKGGIAYAEKQMQNFANKAKKIVANFQNANIRASMLAYIDFVTDRTL